MASGVVFFFFLFSVLLRWSDVHSAIHPSISDVQLEALEAFRDSISEDPLGGLANWSNATHHCSWLGITCDSSNTTVQLISLFELQLRGTISPFLEFAYMRKVTTKVDVFSFGVVIMELLTRRRPTGNMKENGCPLTLPEFVARAIAGGANTVLHVLDPDMNLSDNMEPEMAFKLLELALSCTHAEAEDRPDMKYVLSTLLNLGEKHQPSTVWCASNSVKDRAGSFS